MTNLPLLGRRIHIAGCIDRDRAIASRGDVEAVRSFVAELTSSLLAAGALFVVPIDAEKLRDCDATPICFDWLVLQTISTGLLSRPMNHTPVSTNPLVVAVQHHKTESQIPAENADMWDQLRCSDFVYVENANQWDMNSKRLEMQASQGDILITIGGGEGVLFLANLYHEAGKAVVPLNFPVSQQTSGSQKLFSLALSKQYSERFFRTEDGTSAHTWFNRINFGSRHDIGTRVDTVMNLLKALERPTVFGIRLLNSKHDKFEQVEQYFEGVVMPVVASLGYKLVIVDGKKSNQESLINLEIFTKLHRSAVVLADMTGERPNNFIELGYALGRGHQVMVTAADGTQNPFDIQPIPTHFWNPASGLGESKRALLDYWEANARRRRIVEPDPLVP
jgi:hypothetical protein